MGAVVSTASGATSAWGNGGTCPRGKRGPVHRVAHAERWPWLPTSGCGILAPHPWCTVCGQVAVLGGGRGMKMGGLVNLLARLERVLEDDGRVVTEAQMRLVVRTLQAIQADDAFALPRETQVKLVSLVVGRFFGLEPGAAETYVRSC